MSQQDVSVSTAFAYIPFHTRKDSHTWVYLYSGGNGRCSTRRRALSLLFRPRLSNALMTPDMHSGSRLIALAFTAALRAGITHYGRAVFSFLREEGGGGGLGRHAPFFAAFPKRATRLHARALPRSS